MGSKTKKELEYENAFLKRYGAHRGIVSVVKELIKWAGIVAISYFISISVEALAGKHTTADLGVGLTFSTRTSLFLAWLFGVSGVGYGWRQGKLRRDTTERLHERIRNLERRIDPGRSSSGLTPRGTTHPKDAE